MPDTDSISAIVPETQSSVEDGLQPNDLSAGLYIVSTPIGNLRDITLRALDTLRAADMILAEDTRQTRKLMTAYDIETPLTAYHDHNAAKRIPSIIKMLKEGRVVAQVSDAGTPLVSDPGFKLARAAIEAGHPVIPVPGASALLAGLVTSGLPSDKFVFCGFLPSKSAARRKELETLSRIPGSLVFFESGNRIEDTLCDMQAVLGDRSVALARELTKRYEEVRRASLMDMIKSVREDKPRGEIVLIVSPGLQDKQWSAEDVDQALQANLEDMGVKRASQHVADLSGWSRRDVYQRALALK